MKINELLIEGVFDTLSDLGSRAVNAVKQTVNPVQFKHTQSSSESGDSLDISDELEKEFKRLGLSWQYHEQFPKFNQKYFIYLITSKTAKELAEYMDPNGPNGLVDTDKGKLWYFGPFTTRQQAVKWTEWLKKQYKYNYALNPSALDGQLLEVTGADLGAKRN